MTKQEIINKLFTNHQKFTSYISLLDDQAFIFSLQNEKWTAGQQTDHIIRSVFPLNLVLGMPKWITKLALSKANRPSKSYDELVQKYIQKLKSGGRASGRYIPNTIEAIQKIELKNKIENLVLKLCKSLDKYSEEEIDKLVLPHPLLGKITLREMMYFTIYHVEHHHEITIRNLEMNITKKSN